MTGNYLNFDLESNLKKKFDLKVNAEYDKRIRDKYYQLQKSKKQDCEYLH